jgi:ubiquinone/menaquinone biosynthesis C-methylase UbiE
MIQSVTDHSDATVVSREKEFWNQRSEGRYDRIRGLISRSIGAFNSYHLLHTLYDPTGLEVLDYGCGRGYDAMTLVRRGAKSVIGFDISDEEVAEAERLAEREGVSDRASFTVADAHQTPFPDASFDLVVGNSILHHLELEKALIEIRRVLRPGGVAYFVEPLWHNPLLRLGRALTPSARTPDEHPLTTADWDTCARVFPGFTHFETELFTVPLMPFNLLLSEPSQKRLAVRAHRFDERAMDAVPALRKHARLTFLTLAV